MDRFGAQGHLVEDIGVKDVFFTQRVLFAKGLRVLVKYLLEWFAEHRFLLRDYQMRWYLNDRLLFPYVFHCHTSWIPVISFAEEHWVLNLRMLDPIGIAPSEEPVVLFFALTHFRILKPFRVKLSGLHRLPNSLYLIEMLQEAELLFKIHRFLGANTLIY